MPDQKVHVLGYNRREVDDFMERLAAEQQVELSSLQSELIKATAEIAQLEQEKQSLEEERQRRSQEQKLLLLATEQIEQAQQALLQAMELQADRERQALRTKMAQTEQQCIELDQQMLAVQQEIDDMLKVMAAVTGAQQPKDSATPASAPAEVATDCSKIPESQLDDDDGDLRVAQVTQESFWGEELELIVNRAADTFTNPLADPAVSEAITAAQAQSSETAPVTSPPEAEQVAASPPAPAATSAPTPSASPADSEPTGASVRASPTVANEIRQVRYRYIVGKSAGEDLSDEEGALIVAKGAKITEEVVLQVEAAGKLPELIINMQLPDTSGG